MKCINCNEEIDNDSTFCEYCGTRIGELSEIEMVKIEGGTFTMGATEEQEHDCEDDEKPAHEVLLSSYYIGKYQVTQRLWREVMGNNPSFFMNDNNPVENVSWNDIQKFLAKLNAKTGKNYRLPTEAEWEYAARGGNQSKGYKYSGSNNIDEVAWYSGNASSTTHPVGQKSPNKLGIYDMSGNVWEWCSDWYGRYDSSAQTNPQGSYSGGRRVARGGSCFSGAQICRVSYRNRDYPDSSNSYLGFRLAMDAQ